MTKERDIMKQQFELNRMPLSEIEESKCTEEMRLLKAFIKASGYFIEEVDTVRKQQIQFPAIDGDKSYRNINERQYICSRIKSSRATRSI